MAEGYSPMPNKSPVWYNSTEVGITGVEACKCGYTVQLFITCNISASESGWQYIGTLPEALRPYSNTRCSTTDNSVSSSAANTCISVNVLTNGKLYIYLFNDKLQIQAIGSVTYISNRG